jgi:diguanylate cyclase (GGDEF)-like protein
VRTTNASGGSSALARALTGGARTRARARRDLEATPGTTRPATPTTWVSWATTRTRTPPSDRRRVAALVGALTLGVLALAGALTGTGPGHGTPAVIVLAVITANRAITAYRHGGDLIRAWALAHTDGLTTMKNHRAFRTDVDTTLTTTQPLGILLVDLDAFKTINDTHGHPFGDRVLQEVAERLQATLDPGCRAYRLGGDEFAITLPYENPAHLQNYADRVQDALTRPITIGDLRVGVRASIGTTTRTPTDTTPTDLLARADAQMYHAKNHPKKDTTRPEATPEGGGPIPSPADHAHTAAHALQTLDHETTHGHDYLWPSQLHTTLTHLWQVTNRLTPVLLHAGAWLDTHHHANRTRHLRAPDPGPDVHATLTHLATAITATRTATTALNAAHHHTQHLTTHPNHPE